MTLNHRHLVLTEDGIVEKIAGDLSVGEICIMTRGPKQEISFDEVGYLAGLHFGDGSWGPYHIQYINTKEKELLSFAIDLHKRNGYYDGDFLREDGLTVIKLNRSFTEMIKGVYGSDKKPLKYTDAMWGKDLSWQASFLAGWFDADSGFSGQTLTLVCAKEGMINDAKIILQYLGINTYKGKHDSLLNGEMFKGWGLSIRGNESYKRFQEIIGLRQYKKQKKLVRAPKIGRKDGCYPPVLGKLIRKGFTRPPITHSAFLYGHTGTSLESLREIRSSSPNIDFLNETIEGLCFEEIKSITPSRSVVYDLLESTDGTFFANGILTHNTNYKTQIFDLYYHLVQRYQRFSVITLRADTLAVIPDYTKMVGMGSCPRVSTALEGISDRIRNGILNKNLSWEHFFTCCENFFRDGAGNLKVNLMFTGYEEPEDIEEFYQACLKLAELRKKWDANTHILFSLTTTVHYSNVPLGWLGRKSVMTEITRDHRFKELIRNIRPLGMSMSFHSGWCFVYQQIIIDAGRLVLPIALPLLKKAWEDMKSSTSENYFKEVCLRFFKTYGLTSVESIRDYFGRDREYNELTITSSYQNLTEKARLMLFKAIKNGKGFKFCTRTPANPNPTCKSCDTCPSVEWAKKNVTGRQYEDARRLEEIDFAKLKNVPRFFYRVVYQVKNDMESRARHKRVLSHVCGSRILRTDPQWAKDYYCISNDFAHQLCDEDLDDRWSGYSFFTISFREEAKGILDAIDKINEQLDCIEVKRIFEVGSITLRGTEFHAIWSFNSTVDLFSLSEKYKMWDKVVRVNLGEKKLEWDLTNEPSPILGSSTSGAYGTFSCSSRYNPIYVMSSMFGISKKKVLANFDIQSIGAVDNVGNICPVCKKNKAGIDLMKGTPSPVCHECYAKVAFKKLF